MDVQNQTKEMASVSASPKKGSLASNYRKIFDPHVNEEQEDTTNEDCSGTEPETLGAIQWTPKGEAELYRHLERNPQLLTKGYDTASAVEVQAFLRHLRDPGTHPSKTGHINPRDIAAAVELSRDCDGILDEAAAELRYWQEYDDESKEKREFENYWLLNWDTSSLVCTSQSQEQSQNEESPLAHKTLMKTAELLDIRELLKLSRLLFMSSQDREEDWTSYSADGPAIFASAFLHLCRLIHCLTRRLVMSSLFIAQSRLRATHGYSRRKEYVKSQDVQTAVDVLGIARDPEYWTDLPRRCKLQVVDDETPGGETITMENEEVVTMLRQSGKPSSQGSTLSGAALGDTGEVATSELQLPPASVLTPPSAPAEDLERQHEGDSDSQSNTSELERKDQQVSVLSMRETYQTLGLEVPKSLRDEEEEPPQPKRVKRSQ